MKEEKHVHAIAVHEGHDILWDDSTKEQLLSDCCGGVLFFNFCPFCGEDVRKIIERITK